MCPVRASANSQCSFALAKLLAWQTAPGSISAALTDSRIPRRTSSSPFEAQAASDKPKCRPGSVSMRAAAASVCPALQLATRARARSSKTQCGTSAATVAAWPLVAAAKSERFSVSGSARRMAAMTRTMEACPRVEACTKAELRA